MSHEEHRQLPEPTAIGNEAEPEREVETLPPISFVYRRNDLFDQYIPKVVDCLRGKGLTVSVHTIEKGIPKDKILEQLEKECFPELSGKVIFADKTCEYAALLPDPPTFIEILDGRMRKKKVGQDRTRNYNACDLDRLFERATQRVLYGWDRRSEDKQSTGKFVETSPVDETTDLEQTGKAMTTLLRSIFLKKEHVPEKIVVLADHLDSHNPRPTPEDIQRWFEEAGFKGEFMAIGDGYARSRTAQEVIQEMDRKGYWVISDRHAGIFLSDVRPQQAVELKLPLPTFFKGVMDKGLIDLDPSALEQEIIKLLDESLNTFRELSRKYPEKKEISVE